MSPKDISDIAQLVLLERESRDRQWWATMSSTYSPHAQITLSWYTGTRAGFVSGSKRMAESGSKAEHKLQPVVVRVNEGVGRAVATLGAEICSRAMVNGVEADLVSVSRLLYRAEKKCKLDEGDGGDQGSLDLPETRQKLPKSNDMEKAAEPAKRKARGVEDYERKADEPDLRFNGTGDWHLVSLDCLYAHDCLTPSIPGETLKVDVERLKRYRSSYRCLSYVLEEKGFPVRTDLPGDDRPETVGEILGSAFRWLEGKES